jgi:sec-independent protein translocase protein TatA
MPPLHIPELVLILVIILVIFGAGKLPQIGGALGKGIREFRRGQAGEDVSEQKTD